MPACDMTQQGIQGKDLSSGEHTGLPEAKRKALRDCSLLWSGRLLFVYDSPGFCVWLTDYALRQCLEIASGMAQGLSCTAEGTQPLLMGHSVARGSSATRYPVWL